jgi:hypothetical protein
LNRADLLPDKVNVVDVVDFNDPEFDLVVGNADIVCMEDVDERHDLEFE